MFDERRAIGLVSAVHVFWYRLTNGLIGGRVMGAPMLLLTTTGRKSGQERTTPLLYLEDRQDLVVVASFGGSDHHPAWWLNLQQHPQATVQVSGLQRQVKAEQATKREKARLWPRLTKLYPGYDDYQKRTKREIPVVILRPDGVAGPKS